MSFLDDIKNIFHSLETFMKTSTIKNFTFKEINLRK